MEAPMFSHLYSEVTHGIRVNVQSAWLKDESSPEHDHYVFAYKVQIINESPYSVQLLHRKWFITDGFGRKHMVAGEGVVGKKPVIGPGDTHEYISGCNFPTPEGKMQGYYGMVRTADGSQFSVQIPAFTMIVPWLLN